MRIAVFGAGALGSLLGGRLGGTHDVLLVGRDPHMATVAEQGLVLEGVTEATVHPRTATKAPEDPHDLVVVTVKAFDTARAAREMVPLLGEGTQVLTLQNGLGNLPALVEQIAPERLIGGTTSHGATYVEPGRVRHAGVGDTTIGAWRADPATAEPVAEAFRSAGIEVEVTDRIDAAIWRKVLVNAAINPVTALACVENGALLDDPGLDACLRQLAEEGAAVARAVGLEITDEEAVAAAERVADQTAGNRSSMLQDVEAGDRTEVEQINGAIADHGDDHDVETWMNDVVRAILPGGER